MRPVRGCRPLKAHPHGHWRFGGGGALLKAHSDTANTVLQFHWTEVCRKDSFGQGPEHCNTKYFLFPLYDIVNEKILIKVI